MAMLLPGIATMSPQLQSTLNKHDTIGPQGEHAKLSLKTLLGILSASESHL